MIPHDPTDDDCLPDPDPPDPDTASRRPADIWVPRGPSGGQEAWDFSITNAFRMGLALADPTAIAGVFASVEPHKNTSQYGHSVDPGRLHILPSGPGGWSDAFRSVLAWIPSETNRSGPTNGSDASFKIAQCISCTLLQGKRARDLEEGTKPDWFSWVCQSWPNRSLHFLSWLRHSGWCGLGPQVVLLRMRALFW